MMTVTICFVISLIEMDTELEAIVNQLIKFKISTTRQLTNNVNSSFTDTVTSTFLMTSEC